MNTSSQLTLVILKPDAVARGLTGEITSRFESKGLQLVACQSVHATTSQLNKHYKDLVKKPYFPDILRSMQSGMIVLQVWKGQNCVSVVRTLLGATDPSKALPGTIRGDLSNHIGRNLCHASDSEESAQYEIELWKIKPSDIDVFQLEHIIYRESSHII